MARQAQTAAAVLGALSIEPMSGYEIRQAITTVLGHFWHESFGQIYPCLAELERDGLVSATPGPRPRSSKYRITPSGRALHAQARRHWKRAQLAMNEALGDERVIALHALVDHGIDVLAEHEDDDPASQATVA